MDADGRGGIVPTVARRPTANGGRLGRQSRSRAKPVRYVGYNKLIPEKLSPEWLLIEWPEGEAEANRNRLSTLPENVSFTQLVDLAKLRWRIERDYQELKQEVGLGHYEGRVPGVAPIDHANPVHRGLRLPHRRTGDDSPLRTSFRCASRSPSVTRQLSTQRHPPARPERHVPHSIATMRVRLIHALVKTLPRCPCCGARTVFNNPAATMTQ